MIEPQVTIDREPDFEEIIRSVQEKTFDEFREISVIAQRFAKLLAPRRKSPKRKDDPFGPKTLKASIGRRVKKFKDGTVLVTIFVRAPKGAVGLWQELGAEHHPAQPFLAPAAERALQDVEGRLRKVLR